MDNPPKSEKEELIEAIARDRETLERATRAAEALLARKAALTATPELTPTPVPKPEPVTPVAPPVTPPPAPKPPEPPIVPPTPVPYVPPEDKAKKEKEPFDPKKEVADFIAEFNLDSLLPLGFKDLPPAHRLKVTRDLKRRIVDIVKSDAQTQYSEAIAGAQGIQKIIGSVDYLFGGQASDQKSYEMYIFEELRNSPEGQALIAEDLKILTEKVKGMRVGLDYGEKSGQPDTPYIRYIDGFDISDITKEERDTLYHFDWQANEFANIPYEWGQEVKRGSKWNPEIIKGHRAKYEQAKKEYEEARAEVLEMKARRETPREKGKAMLEMLQLDNQIQIEQLLNTHPEVEQALADFSKKPGFLKLLFKSNVHVWNTITGKNWMNRGLLAGGAATRWATVSVLGAIGAPIAGGVIGGIRGRYRGKETLVERQKQARRGKKDESEEAANTVSAENLVKRIEDIVKATDKASTQEEKARRLDQLKRRIKYTQDKIEGGLVNFGDVKSTLTNQFNLVNNLNQALVASASLEDTTRKDIDERVERFLSYKAGKIKKAQKAFIKKQMLKGAVLGAGFATAGYGVRWLGEHLGWWGDIGERAPAVSESETPADTSEGFLKRTQDWLKGLKFWGEEEAASPTPETLTPIDTVSPAPADSVPPSQSADSLVAVQAEAERLAAEAAAASSPEIFSTGHEITTNFSIKLGEGGVPKNLETVFNAISANHMSVPTEGINEEFATKSLNMAANLVKLSEGDDVLGISAEEFKNIATFENGTWTLKDHEQFNEVLDQLKENADKKWTDGVLQGQGAAITHIPNISEDSWLKIVQADGLEATSDGIDTGIVGHDAVTPEQITDFSESPMVKEAMPPTPAPVDNQAAIDSARAQVLAQMGEATPPPVVEAVAEGATPEAPVAESTPTVSADNPFNLSPEMLQQVNQVYNDSIAKMFPRGWEQVWENARNNPAERLLMVGEQTIAEGGNDYYYTNFPPFIHKLHDMTGLRPISETLLRSAETNEEYIKRALQKVAQLGQLDRVKL